MPEAAAQVAPSLRPGQRRPRETSSYDPGMSTSALRTELRRRRRVSRRQLLHKAVQIHTGYIEEPFMTPLAALNMLFRHLGVAEAQSSEADEVVTTVVSDFARLQTSQEASQTCRRVRDAVWQHARNASLRASTGSVLGSQVATSLLSASQDPLASVASTQNELESHGKKGLALDVVAALCEKRGLVVERMDWRSLRRQQDRVGTADVSANQRALIAVDMYEPFFVLLFAHSRTDSGTSCDRKHDEPSVPTPATQGSLRAHTGSTLQFLQLVSTSQHPTPWRVIFKNQTRRLPHSLCTVAAIYRDPRGSSSVSTPRGNETVLDGSRSLRFSSLFPHDGPHATSRSGGEGSNSRASSPACADADPEPTLPEETVKLDEDWSVREARFTQEAALHDDPFYKIPRVERSGARGRHRRVWTEKLRVGKRSRS